MRALATIVALLLVVAAAFMLLGGDEPVLATHARAVDVDRHDPRTTPAPRPRIAGQHEGSTKPERVDPIEIIGLMMMLGAPHGR